MDFALDDEQALIVSTIRRFADKSLREWAGDADRAGAPPPRLVDVAGDVGFFLDAVPAAAEGLLEGEYGHLVRGLRAIELGRGCAGMAALLETNVEPALAVGRWGGDAARAALYGSLARGGFAATARDATGAMAVRDDGGGGLELSGAIGPLPALAAAGHVLFAGRIGEAQASGGEPVLALLPADAEGVAVRAITPSGWRAARWGAMACERVRVAKELVLARGDAAAAATAEVLAWYRVNLAARAVGVAAAAMEHSARYGAERVQFGQPIGSFEALARMRDENETAIAAARALVWQAAWQIDRRAPEAGDTASRARAFAAGVVARATIDAVQIYGGYGFVNDYPVEKLMRDARAFEVLLGNEGFERVRSIASRAAQAKA